MQGKRVGLYIDTQRYRCRECGKTFMEPLSGISASRMMTDRLEQWIGQQSVSRTFASVADEVGVVEGTVRNIFHDYIAKLEQGMHFEVPRWMGIDEIHLLRKPRCVITDVRNNTIVEILSNRNKSTVMTYLTKLKDSDCIQYVAIDMWTPYREVVEVMLPQATIIIDKFHVVRMANDALERVRKQLRAELEPKARRGLMHDRFVLLKRAQSLSDQDHLKLSGWTQNYPLLGVAYELKEGFFAIYEQCSAPAEAERRYRAWRSSIPADLEPCFKDLVRAFENWRPYILAYFDHPITNAYTESLNNLIRVMNRLGRGYSFEALRAKVLFTEGAHRHKQARPRYQRWSKNEAKAAVREQETTFDYALPQLEPPPQPASRLSAQKNYGADISTLIKLIENGGI